MANSQEAYQSDKPDKGKQSVEQQPTFDESSFRTPPNFDAIHRLGQVLNGDKASTSSQQQPLGKVYESASSIQIRPQQLNASRVISDRASKGNEVATHHLDQDLQSFVSKSVGSTITSNRLANLNLQENRQTLQQKIAEQNDGRSVLEFLQGEKYTTQMDDESPIPRIPHADDESFRQALSHNPASMVNSQAFARNLAKHGLGQNTTIAGLVNDGMALVQYLSQGSYTWDVYGPEGEKSDPVVLSRAHDSLGNVEACINEFNSLLVEDVLDETKLVRAVDRLRMLQSHFIPRT